MDFRIVAKGTTTKLSERVMGARRKLATAALVCAAIWLFAQVLTSPNGIIVYQKKRAEYRELQHLNQQLEQENKVLEERTKKLKANDPATIEKEAREQLRYARPGEMVYVMPDQSKTSTAQAQKK